jgi:hypothetical protein
MIDCGSRKSGWRISFRVSWHTPMTSRPQPAYEKSVSMSGRASRRRACSLVSQFPALLPDWRTGLEGHDSLGHAAIEQAVFGRFSGKPADRRQPQINESRRQAAKFQNAPVLLKHGSAALNASYMRC